MYVLQSIRGLYQTNMYFLKKIFFPSYYLVGIMYKNKKA